MNSNESARLQQEFGWNGSTIAIPRNRSTQISTYGCKKLCGTGPDYYGWDQASSTITTWVLPVIGVLLQAPLISNAFWETCFSIARWCGSPIASLTYILWNIKISGKCALMADMAAAYDNVDTDEKRESDFASMRDSLYLLSTMNQYSINPDVLRTNRHDSKPAEGLLRMVLFSKDLRLLKRQRTAYELEPPDELNTMRQKLAQQLRESRRKGVVPVFISTLWFLFAMAISIQSSFGEMGKNVIAHDLALGCLLAWLPVLILCSIVDRNPVSADDSRKKLNRLVDHVRKSIMDAQVRSMFVNTIDAVEERSEMRRRIEEVSLQCLAMDRKHFFESFAGQGRKRWHYGAAHPILCDIEDAYVAGHGRHWLQNEARARTFLVLGKRTGGLDWLDYREFWQIAAATMCVCATILGAWILSFNTPTVGLGCRSGGYTVFAVTAVFLLFTEMLLNLSKALLKRQRSFQEKLKNLTPQERWEYLFFRPLELGNTSWLLYRALSQTFGVDNTCDCMSSIWAGGGGYIDFTQWNTANSKYVRKSWIAGTTISVTAMSIAMAYIVLEYCLQSHLSTADPKDAALGLQRVRRFRRLTYPARWLLYRFDGAAYAIEVVVATKLKDLGIFSSTYEIRPMGLKWSKNPPRILPESYATQARQPNRARAGSSSPLMRPVSEDGSSALVLQPAHFPDSLHASHGTTILSGDGRDQHLSPEGVWRLSFDVQASRNASPRRSVDGLSSLTPGLV
ncbi:hypothetical protein M433DRAFT_56739 [Acidomyces richmondensis BFW]|nr:MAG: hypothetical protein FE78DRAFT_141551 [Acidomyces sp. 'richmondensis']KYG50649.1 hypothetical protein M433DRAFT_56739 [Acidomyces richmondensis BFW]